MERESYDLLRIDVQSHRSVYDMRQITPGLLVYFDIHGYEIHPNNILRVLLFVSL